MSRSGYSDDIDNWALIKWRGQVASAIRGKRGQKLLADLLAALDAMPEKRLIREELEADGEVCTLGALGVARGIDMKELDPEDYDQVAAVFGIAPQLAQEIVYLNDEHNDFIYEYPAGRCVRREVTPEERWKNMRAWVVSKIASTGAEPTTEKQG